MSQWRIPKCPSLQLLHKRANPKDQVDPELLSIVVCPNVLPLQHGSNYPHPKDKVYLVIAAIEHSIPCSS